MKWYHNFYYCFFMLGVLLHGVWCSVFVGIVINFNVKASIKLCKGYIIIKKILDERNIMKTVINYISLKHFIIVCYTFTWNTMYKSVFWGLKSVLKLITFESRNTYLYSRICTYIKQLNKFVIEFLKQLNNS